MRNFKNIFYVIVVTIAVFACNTKIEEKKDKKITQSFLEHEPTQHHKIALEVLSASKDWIHNFNNGNASECVAGYNKDAIMNAIPFGIKKGINEIGEFWTSFLNSGAKNLIYTNVKIEVANAKTAYLSANWSMNVGRGIIFQEKWEKKNGLWLLTYDNFQVLEQFKKPKLNNTNPVASHLELEEVIATSAKWITGFNNGNESICGNGYAESATMNAIPFASLHTKKEIAAFWKKLIEDGATNLIYHNPIFEVLHKNTIILSSRWSMNIGEGRIYQEKWEKIGEDWLLTYDEFEVLSQY